MLIYLCMLHSLYRKAGSATTTLDSSYSMFASAYSSSLPFGGLFTGNGTGYKGVSVSIVDFVYTMADHCLKHPLVDFSLYILLQCS